IIKFGRARDRDAASAVEGEEREDVRRLGASEKLLEPRGIFEPELQGFRALVGVSRVRPACHPVALLPRIEELAQAFDAAAGNRAHVSCHAGSLRLAL